MASKKGEPFVFENSSNYACLCGQRCNFYIFIERNGHGNWSTWMKGKDAATFWDECVVLNGKPQLMQKLIDQYNLMGRWT